MSNLVKKPRTVPALKYAVLVCISFMLVFPMIYMLANSFMESGEVMKTYAALADSRLLTTGQASTGFKLIPDRVSFMQYYNVLFRRPRFLLYFWNSVIMTVPIMLGQIIVAFLAAYAFGKLRFPFRDRIFFIYIIIPF